MFSHCSLSPPSSSSSRVCCSRVSSCSAVDETEPACALDLKICECLCVCARVCLCSACLCVIHTPFELQAMAARPSQDSKSGHGDVSTAVTGSRMHLREVTRIKGQPIIFEPTRVLWGRCVQTAVGSVCLKLVDTQQTPSGEN